MTESNKYDRRGLVVAGMTTLDLVIRKDLHEVLTAEMRLD